MGSNFDELARKLASDMPRRKVLKLVAGGLIGAVGTSIFGGAAAADGGQSGRVRADGLVAINYPNVNNTSPSINTPGVNYPNVNTPGVNYPNINHHHHHHREHEPDHDFDLDFDHDHDVDVEFSLNYPYLPSFNQSPYAVPPRSWPPDFPSVPINVTLPGWP